VYGVYIMYGRYCTDAYAHAATCIWYAHCIYVYADSRYDAGVYVIPLSVCFPLDSDVDDDTWHEIKENMRMALMAAAVQDT